MESINSLTQLIQQSGCQYTIYDLGRRVQRLNTKKFKSIEAAQQAYPFPLQRHAHLAIAYWNEKKQPWIWFLKFTLDERGLLKQTDINHFIKYVIEVIGISLHDQWTEEQQQKLTNNPYIFTPKEDKMAIFNSLLRRELQQSMSQYYQHANAYLSGKNGWDNWQYLGIQGLADICVNLDKDNNGIYIRKALFNLPTKVLYAILGCLEHINLPEKLADKQSEIIDQLCSDPNVDIFLLSAHIRALSGAQEGQLQQSLKVILTNEKLNHPEVLIAIAGRCWLGLKERELASLFLLRVAQTSNQSLFNQLFSDLVMLPELRLTMLQILHGKTEPTLTQALIQLQKNIKG